MLDMSKKFMYLEDNGDGTVTITLNLKEAFGGTCDNVTVVQQGSIESLIGSLAGSIPEATVSEFHQGGTVIPNDVSLP